MDRKVLLGLALTLVIIAFIPLYWAAEPGRQSTAKARQTVEAAARGVELYSANCAVCHGQLGEGKAGPALKGTRLEANILEKVISRGRPGTAMPPWAEDEGGSLKEHQIKDLVVFIQNWDNARLEKAKHAATPGPTPVATPAPATTSADRAAQGRQLYTSKGCAACHGPKAEGTTIAPALPGRNQEQVIRQVRSPVGTMPRFGPEAIGDEELKLIAAYIASLAPPGATH